MRRADPGTTSSTQVSARAPDSSRDPLAVLISAVTFPYSRTCRPSAVAATTPNGVNETVWPNARAASRRASCLPSGLDSASDFTAAMRPSADADGSATNITMSP
jgi:hypothetical protein